MKLESNSTSVEARGVDSGKDSDRDINIDIVDVMETSILLVD